VRARRALTVAPIHTRNAISPAIYVLLWLTRRRADESVATARTSTAGTTADGNLHYSQTAEDPTRGVVDRLACVAAAADVS
jgi:hypothetical protein